MEPTEFASRNVGEILSALGGGYEDARIEALSTLPHSHVARLTRRDGQSAIFKRAGSADFAPGMLKELVINRDVLSRLPQLAAPVLLAWDAEAELPWLIFEDVSRSHQPAKQPPSDEQIANFVRALAKTHAQSATLPLRDLFALVEGDIHVGDGAELVPVVLDTFLHSADPAPLPRGTFEILVRIRDGIPMLGGQLQSQPGVLVHGDAHFGNAFYRTDDAVLIDWALAVIGPGEVDLCHALAMNLPRHIGANHEKKMMRQYAASCSEFGHPLTESEVFTRYRNCLLLTVIVAVGMSTVPGMPEPVSRYMITNAINAAIEHDSLVFLG
jgi:hypothetical protein